jgi:flagellar biosynthetic protein FliR
MVTASFSIHNLEFFLLILARVASLIYAAPFFNTNGIPSKVKVGLSFFLSLIVAMNVDYYDLEYNTVFGYSVMVMKEVLVGLAIGFSANFAMYTLSFAGHIIDVDLGFSMVQLFDPLTNQNSSAFGSFYTYMVMLVMMVSNMHYFVLDALMDSFDLIPLDGAGLHMDSVYDSIIVFATQYFVIGFRIILPVFAATLLLNIVLGILAKAAPQMNMFVVGMQLKVLMGLGVLIVIVVFIPTITEFVYEGMQDMVSRAMQVLTP